MICLIFLKSHLFILFFKLANTVEKIFLQNPLISAYYKRDRVYIFVIGYSLQSKHSLRLYYTHIVNSAVMYRLPKSRVFSLTKYRFHGKKINLAAKFRGWFRVPKSPNSCTTHLIHHLQKRGQKCIVYTKCSKRKISYFYEKDQK